MVVWANRLFRLAKILREILLINQYVAAWGAIINDNKPGRVSYTDLDHPTRNGVRIFTYLSIAA